MYILLTQSKTLLYQADHRTKGNIDIQYFHCRPHERESEAISETLNEQGLYDLNALIQRPSGIESCGNEHRTEIIMAV